jgi:bacteriorhodopsin
MVVSQGKRDVTNLIAGLYLGIGSSIVVGIWVEFLKMKFFPSLTTDEISNWFWVMTAIIGILLGAILLYFSGLLKEVRASTAQSTGEVTPMNDFDSIVDQYKGKLKDPNKIVEALKIMLEKKNHMQITIYQSTYSAFIVVAGLAYGFITAIKSTDPLFLAYFVGGLGVFYLLNHYMKKLFKNTGKIKPDLFKQYLDAIIKLEEK